jgi:hypothetical protein
MNTEELSQAIGAFLEAAMSASDSLAKLTGIPLEYAHIEDALMEVLGTESPVDLLTQDLTSDAIVSLLDKYNFRRLLPELIEEIRVERSIIPQKGTQRRLTEVTIRSKGEIWRVHRNDADPWPSNPHAHNLESGLKLHLGTGELFLRRQSVGKRIRKKDLEIIRSKVTNCELPPLEV